jgi:hypothetical protein
VGETQYLNHGCTRRRPVDLQPRRSAGETHGVGGVNPNETVDVVRVQVAAAPQNCLNKTCKSPPRRVTIMWSKLWARMVRGSF